MWQNAWMIPLHLSAFAAAAVLAMGIATPCFGQTQDFDAFLADLRKDALQRGISESTLDAAFQGVEPIPRVIELDRRQPEFTLTYQQYLDRTVSAVRIEKGRRLLAEHKPLLDRIAKQYGVQPRFMLALWGMETDYGRVTGGFHIVGALATLAWDGRRSAFFRKELMDALQVMQGERIPPAKMTGSWAGAMGQCQFMPSSFVRFAKDGDGDGRRDIWGSLPDVFASTANYLSGSGWKDDQTWGREVTVPADVDAKLIGPDVVKPLSEWARLGVRRADGRPLPQVAISASLVRPEAGKDPTFLVYDNWRVIMKWNRSTFYALAVGHLADRIGSR